MVSAIMYHMTPILALLLALKEELFDNKDHGIKANNRAKGPKKLEVIKDITHYGVYTTAREQAHKLSEAWFDQYLKK